MDTDQHPIVTTPSGQLRGLWRQPEWARHRGSDDPAPASAAFLGIPFAHAPVGEYRFLAPHPVPSWEGVREAIEYGATAQRRPFGEVTAIPEPSIPGDEVLHVNVFTPAPGRPEERLPVLFWIHGGGYKAGSPASPWYDGAAFNRDGVVTVTVGYRLGFDGFGVMEGAPANRGLLDQVAGLEWVRSHIASFGGDPDNVTIAGQSAGGGSVLALMACPLARGLFHAAICVSGALRPIPADEARARTAALAEQLGVEATLAGFSGVDHDAVLDATEVLERPAGVERSPQQVVDDVVEGGPLTGLVFSPSVDPTTLPDDWVAAVAGNPVPLVMGATAHEFTGIGNLLAPALGGTVVEDLLRASALGEFTDEYREVHPDLAGPLLLGQVMTDKTCRRWVPTVATARHQAGHETWVYDFRWVNRDSGLASHCADLPFVWDHLDEASVPTSSGPDAPQELADLVHLAWVGFTREHAMPWRPWSEHSGATMVLDAQPADTEGYRIEPRLTQVIEGAARSR